jgi:transglutaminase/protease-like cytokinesis protein 3
MARRNKISREEQVTALFKDMQNTVIDMRMGAERYSEDFGKLLQLLEVNVELLEEFLDSVRFVEDASVDS